MSFPAPDMRMKSSGEIDAGIQSAVIPDRDTKRRASCRRQIPARPRGTDRSLHPSREMPPAQSQVVNGAPGASMGRGRAAGRGSRPRYQVLIFHPLSQIRFTAKTVHFKPAFRLAFSKRRLLRPAVVGFQRGRETVMTIYKGFADWLKSHKLLSKQAVADMERTGELASLEFEPDPEGEKR